MSITYILHSDLDGVVPLLLVKYYNLEYTNINNTSYGLDSELKYLDALTKDDTVYYVDFSPNEDARKLIENANAKCIILDHHEGIYDEIKLWCDNYSNAEYIYNVSICGTKIFYDYLLQNGYEENQTLTEIVNLVDTYDMWRKESSLWEQAQNLNRLLFKMLNWMKKDGSDFYDTFINSLLWKCNNCSHFKFSDFEQKKIDMDIKQENELFDKLINPKNKLLKTRKDEKGNYFCVFKGKKKISILCSRILERFKKLDYIIAINEFDEENPKISVRCKEGFNILSKLENVSGHDDACGYTDCSKELCEKIWDNRYNIPRID